jgi:anaerobic selenocysteine-containing dehydrogenase
MKTREGRPVKIEGNPAFPINQGGLTSRMSAQILALYSPDRLQNPLSHKRGGGEAQVLTWDQVDEKVVPKLKEGDVVILSSSLASPSTDQLIGDFFQAFKGRHVMWDALGAEDVKQGQLASYGSAKPFEDPAAPKFKPTAAVTLRFLTDAKVKTSLSEQKVQEFVANSITGLDPRDVSVIISEIRQSLDAESAAPQSATVSAPGEAQLAAVAAKESVQTDSATESTDSESTTLWGLTVTPEEAKKLKVYAVVTLAVLLVAVGLAVFGFIRLSGERNREKVAAPGGSTDLDQEAKLLKP